MMSATDIAYAPNAAEALTRDDLDNITDIYVPNSASQAERDLIRDAFCYRGVNRPVRIENTELRGFVSALVGACNNKHKGETDFRVFFENRYYRGHRDPTLHGSLLALRHIPAKHPKLENLQFDDPSWPALLLNEQLKRGGLIMFCAETGQGKTTLASATVVSRCERFGAFCRTVEDPCEYVLDKGHGDGIVIQTPVDEERGFAHSIRAALRSYPALPGNILFLGEVRDHQTAALALTAANDGHLVIVTLHASTVPTAVERFLAMATHELGYDQARHLLAGALRLGFCQHLQWHPNRSGWERATICGHAIYSPNYHHPIATNIRDNSIKQLHQYAEKQRRLFREGMVQKRKFRDIIREIEKEGEGQRR